MEIHFDVSGKKTEIFIMNKLDNKNEEKKVIEFLKNDIGEKDIRINFFSARVIGKDLIEEILKITKTHKIKLYVFNRHLSRYLAKIGIKNICPHRKSMEKSIKAIAIGGSAGSLDKIIKIIENLNIAKVTVFIVQHIQEDKPNLLPDILERKTTYSVKEGEDGEIIEEKKIYIAPPSFHMKAVNGRIKLSKEPSVNFARPSIEVLFDSLAECYREHLTAVYLCGYGSDGAESVDKIKANNGRVIILECKDCEAKQIPQNVIKKRNYDNIFTTEEIYEFLNKYIADKNFTDEEMDNLLEEINEKYFIDFSNYEKQSMRRRIISVMLHENYNNFFEFKNNVLKNKELFEDVLYDIPVNITSFFRNPAVFKCIREKIGGYIGTYPNIKIWCAGCSSGEEAYSIAIIMKELGLLEKTLIYATDMSGLIIKEAKNGYYSTETFERSNKNYFESGGTGNISDYFDFDEKCMRIKGEIADKVLFFEHSLVDSGVINEFNLILCRNVMIYFNNNLKEKTIKLFNDSLTENGFLILGESEGIQVNKGNKYFADYNKGLKIYKKK